jgi:tetratricopeptide (TPR) repeat protein
MRIAMLLMAIAAAAVGSPAAVAQSTSRRLTFAAAALGSVGLQHRLPAADARRSKKAPPKKKAAAPLGVQSAAAKALLKQGKDAQRMGDGARALAHFDQATDAALADGDSATAARAHGAAGRLLLSVGEGGQAVERLGQAVAADPSYSAGHLNLAHAHLTNGDHRRGQSA